MTDDASLPTPCLVIDAEILRPNLARMADYTRAHGLALRPHTKTHKSTLIGRMQIEQGAAGLTVAKAGEARVMAAACDDLLMAYSAVDPARCAELAELARERTVRTVADSATAVERVAEAARAAGVTVGLLVDLDVGHHRTGVQTAAEALALAQLVDRTPGVRLDGILFYPGHIPGPPLAQDDALRAVDAILAEVLDLWRQHGLTAAIVSGGSTPTAYQSHLVPSQTEIRPGTYVFNDMNCVRAGIASLERCAAHVLATVISTAVPGQIVLDAGSKTLTMDRCSPAPDSGHGHLVGFPEAKITKLSEEHAQVDVSRCAGAVPRVGDRVRVIPNHVCPCVNLQDHLWWAEPGGPPRRIPVEARGRVW